MERIRQGCAKARQISGGGVLWRRAITLVAIGWVVLAGSSKAAQPLEIANRAGAPRAQLERVERAVSTQVRRDFAPRWGTDSVRFSRQGWQIALAGSTSRGLRDCFCFGWHSTYRGRPYAMIGVGGLYNPWSITLSHEVVEMLADPSAGGRHEVADPVSSSTYRIGGVIVSDFVLPSWYLPGSRGPWDFLGVLPGPGISERGRGAPVTP